MTSKDNPREPEPAYLRSDQRINDMAELLNMRRERIDALVAELATAQDRTRALEAENTKLHGQLNALAQRRDPPGSYLIRSPGVYVVTPSQRSAAGLDVYRHKLEDAVVLTAHPDEEPASWWQLYRDGITGKLTAWHPPKYLHEKIASTAMAMQDPSEKPWVGIDPGKPGDDLTTVGLRVERRVDRLEREKMAILERENSLFGKVARLEGWARQFHPTQSTAILATPIGNRHLAIDPLDHLEHKG